MRKLLSTLFIASAITLSASADDAVKAKLHADKPGAKINREIYGQFSEHLGSCIYGGLWVGENSPIPNIKGYRKDVFEALKKLQIPAPTNSLTSAKCSTASPTSAAMSVAAP